METLPATSTDLRALTIKQPYAALVVDGVKDIENRSWRTRYRGPLAIHAGRKVDRDALSRYAYLLDAPDDLPRGVLLGTVELVDCVRDSTSEWADPGAWHWILRDPRPFPEPIPCRGAQGLWRPPARLGPSLRG
jgi:hypothetical protein